MKLRIFLSIFSFLMLAAHFSRIDNTILMIISLLIPLLFFYKKAISLIIIQVLAYLAASVWIFAMFDYIQKRIDANDSWTVLFIIMTTIALFSSFSGYLLNSSKMKEKYK